MPFTITTEEIEMSEGITTKLVMFFAFLIIDGWLIFWMVKLFAEGGFAVIVLLPIIGLLAFLGGLIWTLVDLVKFYFFPKKAYVFNLDQIIIIEEKGLFRKKQSKKSVRWDEIIKIQTHPFFENIKVRTRVEEFILMTSNQSHKLKLNNFTFTKDVLLWNALEEMFIKKDVKVVIHEKTVL